MYLLARTVFWGILSGYALIVIPIKYDDALKFGPATNLIHRLNLASVACFEEHHPNINHLVGSGKNGFSVLFLYIVILFFLTIALLVIF